MSLLTWVGSFLRKAIPPPVDSSTATPPGLPSRELIEFVRAWEGCRLEPYRDVAGHFTIGVGHLMLPTEPHKAITSEQADLLLTQDLTYTANRVRELTYGLRTQGQADALISFAFNVGSKALANSTLLRYINAGEHIKAVGEFAKWNKARIDGVLTPIAGLTARRKAEAAMYLRGDYQGRP